MVLTQGSIDKSAILLGDWCEISILYNGDWIKVGNVTNGSITILKEQYQHISTAFPRKVDLIIPTRAGLSFKGNLEEIHAQNMRLALGLDPSDDTNYIYWGKLDTPIYFSLRARRNRPSDLETIEVMLYKCQIVSTVEIGGGDTPPAIPFEAIALDDEAGEYGGSADAPLGYIHTPAKAIV